MKKVWVRAWAVLLIALWCKPCFGENLLFVLSGERLGDSVIWDFPALELAIENSPQDSIVIFASHSIYKKAHLPSNVVCQTLSQMIYPPPHVARYGRVAFNNWLSGLEKRRGDGRVILSTNLNQWLFPTLSYQDAFRSFQDLVDPYTVMTRPQGIDLIGPLAPHPSARMASDLVADNYSLATLTTQAFAKRRFGIEINSSEVTRLRSKFAKRIVRPQKLKSGGVPVILINFTAGKPETDLFAKRLALPVLDSLYQRFHQQAQIVLAPFEDGPFSNPPHENVREFARFHGLQILDPDAYHTGEMDALAATASVVVTPNTGLVHMTAALGNARAVVALYSDRVAEWQFAPPETARYIPNLHFEKGGSHMLAWISEQVRERIGRPGQDGFVEADRALLNDKTVFKPRLISADPERACRLSSLWNRKTDR